MRGEKEKRDERRENRVYDYNNHRKALLVHYTLGSTVTFLILRESTTGDFFDILLIFKEENHL